MQATLVRPILIVMIGVLCAVCLSGCDDDVALYDFEIAWTSDNPYPGDNNVTLFAASSDPDELLLAVDLYNITNGPTHGVAFDLVFRDEVLRYIGFEAGSVLEPMGSVMYQASLDPQDPGRLIVGVSLTGNMTVENADGPVIFLRFGPRRSGTGPVTFENARILTAESNGTYPVSGIAWYGGYATIVD
ncbi:hypothetical protein JXA80_07660 [bacterium]|nr:hypothetical protein [candidate division CSSED10-310 bacterium]